MTAVSKHSSWKQGAIGSQVTLKVVARLWALIESGELRLGDKLDPERDLARKMKVSRPSLRSGIAFLATIGILKIKQGEGTYVISKPPMIQLDPALVVGNLSGSPPAFHEARLVIESSIVGIAARRLRSAHAAELAERLTDMYASLDQPQEYYIHELFFHRAIARAAGNAVLLVLFEATVSSHYECLSRRIDRTPDLRHSAEAHRDIYLAIRSHDPSRASRLMERYLKANVKMSQPGNLRVRPAAEAEICGASRARPDFTVSSELTSSAMID